MKKPFLRTQKQRIIALFFLFTFLNTFVPYNNLYGQSNGPSAPEAASFEPVDAMDMVDLTTGDFSYVLPLMNVPSPEGGYPIALSYHAGIALDQPASWVGLGWNLNPGSIMRSVSYVPDDIKNQNSLGITFSKGGVITSNTISEDLALIPGVLSIGRSFSHVSHKTYKGEVTNSWKQGVHATVGFKPPGSPVGIGVTGSLSVDQDGEFDSSVGVRVSYHGVSLSVSTSGVGLSYSGEMADSNFGYSLGANMNYGGEFVASAGLTYYQDKAPSQISMGVSLSGSSGGNLQMFGNSLVNKSNGGGSGTMRFVNNGFTFTFPTPIYTFTYSKNKKYYWFFDTTFNKSTGSLYPQTHSSKLYNSNFSKSINSDSYTSSSKISLEGEYASNPYTAVAYDSYRLMAEGLSGSLIPSLEGGIIPFSTIAGAETHLLNRNTNYFEKDDLGSSNSPSFYLEGSNSGYMNLTHKKWSEGQNFNLSIGLVKASITDQEIEGLNNLGYNSSKKRKYSGNYTEVFTNKQLIANPSLVIGTNGFDRNNASLVPEDGIGAYKITSLDGKVYHYTIPVYQREKVVRTSPIDEGFEDEFILDVEKDPYATHWLLTAITGPDYIDSNNNNILDDEDYGYWVDFDYGKWSDGISWRSPASGYHSTLKYKSYSYGVKDVYYLDAIKTRTHTAFFVKDVKGYGDSPIIADNKDDYLVPFARGGDGWALGDDNIYYSKTLKDESPYNTLNVVRDGLKLYFKTYTNISKHKNLFLKEIRLYLNKDIPTSLSKGVSKNTNFSGSIDYSYKMDLTDVNYQHDQEGSWVSYINRTWDGEYYENVYDSEDFSSSDLTYLSLLKFDYDYSLQNGYRGNPNLGKLALRELTTIPRNTDAQVMPPYKFSYNDVNRYYNKDNKDVFGYVENQPEAWSLSEIQFPIGTKLSVSYESDDFDQEILNNEHSNDKIHRIFSSNLRFELYKSSLGDYMVEVSHNDDDDDNEVINFTDYFKLGQAIIPYLSFSVSHQYYNDGDCRHRHGLLLLQDDLVEMTSVESDKLIFKILDKDKARVINENGGISWLFDETYYYGGARLSKGEKPVVQQFKATARHLGTELLNCSKVTTATLYYKLASNQFPILTTNIEKRKGGIRVKEITNGADIIKKYYYNKGVETKLQTSSDYVSSGTISFMPREDITVAYSHMVLAPSPIVMYENVKVTDGEGSDLTMTSYEHYVLKNDLDDKNELGLNIKSLVEEQSFEKGGVNVKKYKYTDMSSRLGSLLSMSTYNSQGQILSISKTNYDDFSELDQGTFGEGYYTFTEIGEDSFANYSTNIKLLNNIESVSTFSNNIKTTSRNLEFDLKSGAVTKNEVYNSLGEHIVTESKPAYNFYSEMGSKVDDIEYKNMLSQPSYSISKKIDADGTEHILGANITTWNNDWIYKTLNGTNETTPIPNSDKVWRKHKEYIWNGVTDSQGYYVGYNEANEDSFDWAIGASQDGNYFQQTSEISLYNHNSRPLEIKDINGNYASTKMCDDDTKVLAVSNAKYDDMYYTGMEYGSESGITILGKPLTIPHTGSFSVPISKHLSRDILEVNIPLDTLSPHREKKYKVSVWIYVGFNLREAYYPTFSGEGQNTKWIKEETIIAGHWAQITGEITIPASGGVFKLNSDNVDTEEVEIYDDFRLYPISSSMTSYVYNKYDELSSIIGDNGLATKYSYDNAGDLIRTYTEVVDAPSIEGGFKLTSKHKKSYKNN